MTLTLESAEVPTEDEAPDIDSPGYDPEVPYGRTKSGRVRKRPVGTATRATGSTPVRSEKLARQATAALLQLNGFGVIGCLSTGMFRTAEALKDRESKLEADLYNALVLDPSMCEYILKAGVRSGKLMLLVAIGMHVGAVVPEAVTEYRERNL